MSWEMGNGVHWYAPAGNKLGVIYTSLHDTHTITTSDYIANFINYNSVSGMLTKLSFTATNDKNGTIVQCWDITVAGLPSSCTIMISGKK